MNKKIIVYTILLITFISLVFNQFIIDTRFYIFLNSKIKDVVEVSLVIIIGIIGNYSFQMIKIKWLLSFWRLIYVGSTIFFIIMFLIDWFLVSYSYKDGQYRFGTIKQFLSGPATYVLLLIVQSQLNKPKINIHN